MIEYFRQLLLEQGLAPKTSDLAAAFLTVLVLVLLGWAANYFVKVIVIRVLEGLIRHRQIKWGTIFLEHKVFQHLSHLAPALLIYLFAYEFPDYLEWLQTAAYIYVYFALGYFLFALLGALEAVYQLLPVASSRPIKGIIQLSKVFIFITFLLLAVAHLSGKSPFLLLSGLGALTAVLVLIFKEPILGFVAGIQLAANDMVRLGDWVELVKHNADGEVVEIALTTIKIRNWDQTITMVPSYAFTTESFKNWRAMEESGARRIMRSILLDVNSIAFCTPEMLEDYKKISLLADYLTGKEKELEDYRLSHPEADIDEANVRHLTNLGTFRAYVLNYLTQHPMLHQDKTILVRQLPAGERGIPLEIYAYVKDTRWVKFEAVQSDIFDHIFSIVPRFGLRVFQSPSGYDYRKA